jgi:hypothetical protein
VSRVKVYSFTSHPERGFAAVTPVGLIVAEPGMQVTVTVSESWEQAADAVRALRKQDDELPKSNELPTEATRRGLDK